MKFRKGTIRCAFAGAMIFVLAVPSPDAFAQTTRYVAVGGSDSSDCTSPASPCETISHAFAEADSGDVIDIAAGGYPPDAGPPVGALVIDKDITIQGAGVEQTVVGRGPLPMEPEYRIFTIEPGGHEVTISDLTILNGLVSGGGVSGRGGGIYNGDSDGQLTLVNVIFDSNEARIGGGLFNIDGGANAVLENVVFELNKAEERGGAIYNWTDATVEIVDSSFKFNSSGVYGGAIFNNLNTNLTLEGVEFEQNQGLWGCGAIAMNGAHPDSAFSDVQFVNNESGGVGGAVCLDNSSPTLTDVEFEGNEAHAINTDAHGGGMRSVNNSSPVLTNVTFTANKADHRGGGMYNADGSSPQLTNVNFNGNQSGREGGGMANVNGSSPSLEQVTFENNASHDPMRGTFLTGGGMANLESSPTLFDVHFIGNSAIHGGGMYNGFLSEPQMQNVTFIGNDASGNGGGMLNQGEVTTVNAIFYDNTAGGIGGGLSIDAGSATLTNVTIHGNQAGESGGGVHALNNTTTVMLDNSMLWHNTASLNGNEVAIGFDASVSLSYSLHANEADDIFIAPTGGSFSCIDCLHDDPQFVDSASGDLQLAESSPAIDAGNPNIPPDTFPGGHAPIDLAGNPRFTGAAIDIGAYEWQPLIDEIFEDRFEIEQSVPLP